MTKTVSVLLAWFALAVAASVQAQPPYEQKIRFVGFHVGAQPQRRTVSTSTSQPLYDEALKVNSSHRVGNGVAIGFDGGYQIWRKLVIGAEFTTFSSTRGAAVAASIPHPLFFNQPSVVFLNVPDLERKERAFHLSAMWFTPVTEDIDVALSIGPSFIHVSQQLVTTGSVASGTQNLTLTPVDASGTAAGVNLGFEGIYKFTPRYGGTLFVRYNRGSVDLPAAPDVVAGGFQVGLGARVRF